MIKHVIAQKLESKKSDTTLDKLSRCFIVRDFFEGVKKIPNDSIHLVEIDPPYAINLEGNKKKVGSFQYLMDNYNEIDIEEYQLFMAKTFAECYRVMSPHSWLICWFAPQPWFEKIYIEL